jgi:hypothetical protein
VYHGTSHMSVVTSHERARGARGAPLFGAALRYLRTVPCPVPARRGTAPRARARRTRIRSTRDAPTVAEIRAYMVENPISIYQM